MHFITLVETHSLTVIEPTMRLREFTWKPAHASLYIIVINTIVFSLLLFNVGIDIGGDDAAYLVRALRFVEHGHFPDFQGAVYPLVISPFVAVLGIDLMFLRTLSVVFMVLAQVVLYRLLKNRLPEGLLLALLLTLSINPYWLHYASLTYSEALFTLLQALALWYAYKFLVNRSVSVVSLVLAAGWAMILCKTKAVGVAYLLAVIFYFTWNRQWKNLSILIGAFAILLVIWSLLVQLFWGGADIPVGSQLYGLVLKDPYDETLGVASLSEILGRFIQNLNYYTSRHILQSMGLRAAGKVQEHWWMTLSVVLFFVPTFVITFKKKSFWTFVAVYVVLALASVFSTPVLWDQIRFIHPFIPFFVIWPVWFLFKVVPEKWRKYTIVLPMFLFVALFFHTQPAVKQNLVEIREHRQGNLYTGVTPDWVNYFDGSKWVAQQKNLGVRGKVACRKPGVSTLMAEKDCFYGIYSVPTYQIDMLKKWMQEDEQFQYIIFDYKALEGKSLPSEFIDLMHENYYGGLFEDGKYSLYRLYKCRENTKFDAYIDAIERHFPIQVPVESLQGHDYSVFVPDSMLHNLKLNNVQYVMEASIRAIPEQRTEYTLSSVKNYMDLVQLKYPKLLTQVQQIGSETLEPVIVYELNYP